MYRLPELYNPNYFVNTFKALKEISKATVECGGAIAQAHLIRFEAKRTFDAYPVAEGFAMVFFN